MTYDPRNHHRHSIRLKEYDYAAPGAYFVTIVTRNRMCLFGNVADGVMWLNVLGRIASAYWAEIPHHFPNVTLDAFVVMPNHIHGIVIVTSPIGVDGVGAQHAAPLHGPQPVPHVNVVPGSLGVIVRSFKSAVTKRIGTLRTIVGTPVWQRNYYEHIIRNERSLNHIREYILNNPLQWEIDWENPLRPASPTTKVLAPWKT